MTSLESAEREKFNLKVVERPRITVAEDPATGITFAYCTEELTSLTPHIGRVINNSNFLIMVAFDDGKAIWSVGATRHTVLATSVGRAPEDISLRLELGSSPESARVLFVHATSEEMLLKGADYILNANPSPNTILQLQVLDALYSTAPKRELPRDKMLVYAGLVSRYRRPPLLHS